MASIWAKTHVGVVFGVTMGVFLFYPHVIRDAGDLGRGVFMAYVLVTNTYALHIMRKTKKEAR